CFLRQPAMAMPQRKFLLAGPQYPADFELPRNVRRTLHVAPEHHAEFYCSSRITLNLTRQDMVNAGYSPSVRLFEAAACGAAIVSDTWPGLETFFRIGEEILVAEDSAQIISFLKHMEDADLRRLGDLGCERLLAEPTSIKR